jgi:hypothetical protein
MPIPTHLLERAYQLIQANQFQNAELVLDAVVRVDPQNMEAWKIYLMICQNQNDLNWLKDRILKARGLSRQDKVRLIEYHQYLTGQLGRTEEGMGRTNISAFLLQEEKRAQASTGEMDNTRLELLDVFDYPKRDYLPRPRQRSRRRPLYNPITVDFVRNIFKTISQTPVGKKLTSSFKESAILIYDHIKNPKDAFAKFSRSLSHFRTNSGLSLLILFVLGIRIVMWNNFLGYILIGIFFLGSLRWLSNHENYSSAQTRIYLQENESNLPMEEEVEQD